MNTFFEKLNKEEQEKMVDAISQITILIAGAEGNINRKETAWAVKLADIRTYAHYDQLHSYYQQVGLHFQEKIDHLLDTLPTDVSIRTRILSDYLAELNPILKKLKIEQGAMMYKSFISFAKHVARSSGGFLGFGAISTAESKLINLPMLTPIIHSFPEDEEE